jgi:hypothetical protein
LTERLISPQSIRLLSLRKVPNRIELKMEEARIRGTLPTLDWVTVRRNGAAHRLPYCFRKGNGGPALLFVHGLGGEEVGHFVDMISKRLE